MKIAYQTLIIGYQDQEVLEPCAAFLLGWDSSRRIYTSFHTTLTEVPPKFSSYFKSLPKMLEDHCRYWLGDRPDITTREVLGSCLGFLEPPVPFRIHSITPMGCMEVGD